MRWSKLVFPRFLLPLNLNFPPLSSTICTASDLQGISEKLPDNFKTPLPDPLVKSFLYGFHSAGYHLMTEVVTALRTVMGHLIKELAKGRKELETETAPEFMLKLYKHLEKEDAVLNEIGVQNASPSQLRCLAALPLTATYSCLSLFCRWVDEGFYDFSMLPFSLKVHLSGEDQQALNQLHLSTDSDLRELQQLVDALKNSEKDIASRVDEAVNVSLSISLV